MDPSAGNVIFYGFIFAVISGLVSAFPILAVIIKFAVAQEKRLTTIEVQLKEHSHHAKEIRHG